MVPWWLWRGGLATSRRRRWGETEFRRAAGTEEVFGLWDEGNEAFRGDLGGRVIFAFVLVAIVGNGG